jgi:hypothetical protein
VPVSMVAPWRQQRCPGGAGSRQGLEQELQVGDRDRGECVEHLSCYTKCRKRPCSRRWPRHFRRAKRSRFRVERRLS